MALFILWWVMGVTERRWQLHMLTNLVTAQNLRQRQIRTWVASVRQTLQLVQQLVNFVGTSNLITVPSGKAALAMGSLRYSLSLSLCANIYTHMYIYLFVDLYGYIFFVCLPVCLCFVRGGGDWGRGVIPQNYLIEFMHLILKSISSCRSNCFTFFW